MSKYALRSLINGFKNKQFSPAEIATEQLANIKRLNPKLKALTYVNEDIIKVAKGINYPSFEQLAGICYTVKDHIDVKGLPASRGSAYSSIKQSINNSHVVELLQAGSALLIGKGNMSELGRSYHSLNPDFGLTLNPHNTDYSAGGSSGGDAAAIAAGFASFAIGSDTGGSLRIPANFCGLYSLHTTPGVISNRNLSYYPHTISSLFRSLGPICNSLDDIEILLRILGKFDYQDSLSIPLPLEFKSQRKFAVLKDLNKFPVEKEILMAIDKISKDFEASGFHQIEIDMAFFEQCLEAFVILWGQAGLIIEDLIDPKLNERLKKEGPIMQQLRKQLADKLPLLSSEQLLIQWHKVNLLRKKVAEIFNEIDFILMPVGCSSVIKKTATNVTIDTKKLELYEAFSYSSLANVLGLPALAFPTGKNSQDLPLGLQLVGARLTDFKLVHCLREIVT